MGTSQTVPLQLPLIAIWRAAEANDALFEIQSREPRGKKFCAQCGNPRTLQSGSCGAQNGREDKFWCVCGAKTLIRTDTQPPHVKPSLLQGTLPRRHSVSGLGSY